MRISDWSSDVCSSDLPHPEVPRSRRRPRRPRARDGGRSERVPPPRRRARGEHRRADVEAQRRRTRSAARPDGEAAEAAAGHRLLSTAASPAVVDLLGPPEHVAERDVLARRRAKGAAPVPEALIGRARDHAEIRARHLVEERRERRLPAATGDPPRTPPAGAVLPPPQPPPTLVPPPVYHPG